MIPARTGINNSDSGLTDGDESMDSTEEELREIETKRKEEEEDERNYTKDDSESKEEENTEDDDDDDDDDDDNDDEDEDDEDEGDNMSRNTDVESSEEEEDNNTKVSTRDGLCSAGESCEQEGGQEIIKMSHVCAECKGRLHGYLCSNQQSDGMNGMVCRLCDAKMAWVSKTDENGNKEGNKEWHVKNNKAKNGKKGKSRNKKTGISPRSIMRTDGGRGRVNSRESYTGYQRRVPIESAETEPEHQDKIHEFSLKVNPYVMKKKGFSLKTIVEVVTRTIDKKTGHTATFHPTTKFPLLPKPISNISKNFPLMTTELQDFFDVQEINPSTAEIHLALTMPGTTQEALHASMKNTLKQYSVWLTSKELVAKQQDLIGWIKNANPTYTDAQEQAKKIQEEITKMAEGNPAAENNLRKSKGSNISFVDQEKFMETNQECQEREY